jgi:acyl-CoA thioesterase FadM
MNKVMTQTYKVQYCDCDKDGILKTSRLCELFEGLAMDALVMGCAGDLRTVMMRYRILFEKPVMGRDVICLKTYLTKSTKYTSVRRFEVTGGTSGAVAVRAAATWSYMSLAKQRITAIPPGTADYVVTDCPPFEEAERLSDAVEGPDTGIQLRADDFDHNGHVNNAKYFSFIALGVPEELRKGRYMKEVTINYEKAVKPDAVLKMRTQLKDLDGCLSAAQKLEDGGKKCALIQTLWERYDYDTRGR